ncbi:MAG: class I SAM-dependent methyltransferase [Oscillospiraceae bacterium]|nr:class I SAM-dependent methyltransferase [Oscillospiraceae bacterium]
MSSGGYGSFAYCYDKLMGEADYAARGKAVDGLIKKHGGKRGILLDLACGTGNMSEVMAKMGYDVIGTDISEEMLNIAMEKKAESGLAIQYLRQDMRRLDMFGTVDVTLCMLDSLNHLCSFEDIEETFKRVSLFSDPEGLFLFDMNTPYKHREILGNNTFVYDLDEVYCVWQNFFDISSTDCRVDISLDFFIPDEKGTYSRLSDELSETAYDSEVIVNILEKAGFTTLEILDGDSFDVPRPDSERLMFAARSKKV